MTDPTTPTPRPIIIDQHIGTVASGGQVIGVLQSAPPPPTSLHQLPPLVSNWTGREDALKFGREQLAAGEVRAAALFGMPGLGKTALAVKLATELRATYGDAQFFFDMQGASPAPRTSRDALAHVIRGFGWPGGALPTDESELTGLYRSLLTGKRVLVLLDNVREAAQVEALLPPDGCLLLLTSRWHFYIDGLQELPLEEWSDAEAGALLVKIAPRAKDDAAAIARVCGNLPQALTWAAKWVRNNRTLLPSVYLAQCRDAATRLKLTGADVALQVSYDTLDEKQRARWSMLSVCPGSFDAAAAAAVWGLADARSSARAERRANDAALEVLNDLVNTSLVEWAESTHRYRLHDLSRAFAGRQLSHAESEDAAFRHAAHFARMLREIDEQYLRGGAESAAAIGQYDREEANIRAGQAWAQFRAASEDRAARICLVYPNNGVEVAKRRLPPAEWIRWLESALAAARRLGERVLEADTLGNLGAAFLDQADLVRGGEYATAALDLIRQSTDRRSEGSALGNLGVAFLRKGESARAIEFLSEALKIHRRQRNVRGEGRVLMNLLTAQLAHHDRDEALRTYADARRVLEANGDQEALAGLAGNLGLAQQAGGALDEADALFCEQLSLAQQAGFRRGEAAAYWNLAQLHAQRGEFAEAHKNLAAAEAIYQQLDDQGGVEDVRRQLTQWAEQTRARDSQTHG